MQLNWDSEEMIKGSDAVPEPSENLPSSNPESAISTVSEPTVTVLSAAGLETDVIDTSETTVSVIVAEPLYHL